MHETKIIIGYDGSDGARDALRAARAVADLAPSAIRAVYGYPYVPSAPMLGGIPDAASVLRDRAESVLATAREELGESPATTYMAIPSTSPPRVLHRMAAEWGADLIVVGSSARRRRFGRVGEQVLHGAPCPVLVASRGYRDCAHGIETITVAFNGSDESGPALREAARLAELAGAGLCVIDVVDVSHGYYPPDWSQTIPECRERLEARAETLVARATRELSYPATAEIPLGDAVDTLIARSREADLLVMGSRDHGPLRRLMLGSVSTTVVRDAACPVLVLPRAAYGRELRPCHKTPGFAETG
jgi:nucleotide-binding universal stress UspA family protein